MRGRRESPGSYNPESMEDQGRRPEFRFVFPLLLAAVVLLALLRGWQASRSDGFTIDEPFHLAAGAAYIRTGDYVLNPEHPPLVKLWVGAFVPESLMPLPAVPHFSDKPQERAFSESVVFGCPDPERLRERVKNAMLAGNGALLFLLGCALRRCAGERLALVSLTALAFVPAVTAHLTVAMTDLPVALLSSSAVLLSYAGFSNWRFRDLAAAGLLLGGALGAKHSALLTLLFVGAMGVVASLRAARNGSPPFLRRLASVAFVLVLALTVLWGLYRFRFHESASGEERFNRPLAAKITDLESSTARRGLDTLLASRLIPRSYLWGLADVARASWQGRGYGLFAFGRSHTKTPFYFFPGLLLVKLPIGFLLLAATGGLLLIGRTTRHDLSVFAPLLLLSLLFFAALAGSDAGYAGVRHALPVFPAVALLAGAGLLFGLESRNVFVRAGVGIAFLAALVPSITAPHPWEYANLMAGGTSHAYRLFNDEGVDIGQRSSDLIRLCRERLRATGETPYIDYPLSTAEARAAGIRARPWAADPGDVQGRRSGIFLVAANRVSPAPWYDLTAFRESEPSERFGNLLVFRGSFSIPWLNARHWCAEGMTLVYGESPDLVRAEELFRRASESYPQAYVASLELGNLVARRGEREAAIRAYERARDFLPAASPLRRALEDQILHLRKFSPESVAPLRNPWLE